MNNQRQKYLKRLTSLRSELERKASDFDDAKNRSIEAAKLGIQELRILTDFVESSILREIEESFEVNRFANALNSLLDESFNEENSNDNNNELEIDKLQELVNENIPTFLGPSKRDFLRGQETIIGLNNWYNKRSLYLPEHIEGRSLGSDCVELVWDKVEGAMGYHVEMRYPNEGSFHRVYEGCETRYKLSGLFPGTRVLFRLRSVVGNGGVSEWSECVEASTAPTASQYLCAEGKSESEITLFWDRVNAPSDDETLVYHVMMRPKNNDGNLADFKEVYSGSKNKCTVEGLKSEEEYLFCVRTECRGKFISQSNIITGRTKIPTPKKFRVRTDNWNEMNLSWNPVVSKTGKPVNYIVEMKKENDTEFTELYSGERTKIRKTEFHQDTEYSFRVRSKCGNEVSEWSDVVNIRTQGIPIPSNFRVSTENWDTVSLSWDRVPSNTEEDVDYIVKMKEGNSSRRFTEVYRGTETHFTKMGLKQNTEYYFFVRSVCKDCGSEWSNAMNAITQKIPVPSNFTAKMSTWGSADLSWEPIVSETGESMNYIITMKNENDSKYTEIYRGTKVNFTKKDLKQNTDYSFRVRSVSGDEMSEWSDITKVKTQKLFAPSNIRATTITSDSVTLTWDSVGGASFYQIEVNEKALDDKVKTNTFTKKGLFPDTEYIFRLSTVRGNEESEWGDIVKVKTQKALKFSECSWKECPEHTYQEDDYSGCDDCDDCDDCGDCSDCPDNVDGEKKYSLDRNNSRIATSNNSECIIIGNIHIPPNKVTSWNIKILISKNNDGSGIHVGVAPFDVNQDDYLNASGWFFNCHGSELSYEICSLWSKKYGPRKNYEEYIRMGDSVGVIMDTTKGDLSFVVNGVNLGVAFKRIPLDKPLVPCVLLKSQGDSIELDLSEVKENVDSSVSVPSNITVKNGFTWDSLILEWGPVEGASFYQIEFDGRISKDLNKSMKLVKRGLLPDTEYSFRVRTVIGNSVSGWSNIVKRKTLEKTFETSGWKKFRGWNKRDKKSFINENNLRTVSTPKYCNITIIGNTSLPPNKITLWNIRASKIGTYIGVSPSDISQYNENYYSCGWYINSYDLTLISGPPHNYRNKKYSPRKNHEEHVYTGDIIGVVMDTTNGELSFALNGINLGTAYEGIPLDKPLVPCVILGNQGDSVELILFLLLI